MGGDNTFDGGYGGYPIPDHDRYEEYDFKERRAFILELMRKRGHPDRIPKNVRLAEMFDVDPSMITRDIDRIKEDVASNTGPDLGVTVDSVLRRIQRDLASDYDKVSQQVRDPDAMEPDELRKMLREKREIAEEIREPTEAWTEFIFDSGAADRAAEEKKHTIELDYEVTGSPEIDEEEFIVMKDED